MATPAKLAVILHADVVGSTGLVRQDERVAHDRMQAAFKSLSGTIKKYHGKTHELRGDALVAVFERASDAVSAALAFQHENERKNHGIEDCIRPHIRIGIALGEVIIGDGTITGAGVVLAQRLEQLAEPDGLCVSAALREAIPARLPFEYGPLGEQRVKGFDEPVRVFSIASRDAVPAPELIRQRWGSRVRQRVAVAAVLVTLCAGLGAWFAISALKPPGGEEPPGIGTQMSIAVLPLVNLHGDEQQNYFADAITADLTSDLSRIAGSFVISQSTASAYRGQDVDPKAVARELNVRYLLEGTVRREGSEVRVDVQLVDGVTGQQLWSERYQKAASDMYAFQDEVTGRVARTLNLELKQAMSRQAARGEPSSLDANDLAQRAWAELWTKPQSATTNEAALSYVSRALEIDPNHAEALGVAAYAYARAATYGWGISREEALAKGIEAGDKSVSIDPKNADAIYSLGFLYYIAGETLKSKELMRLCIEVNRNHAPAYFFYGLILIRLGQPRDAIEWVQRAFALSPRDPLRAVWHGVVARAYLLIGEDELAIETAQKGVASNSRHSINYAVLASAYAHQGNMEKAKAALAEFEQAQTGITVGQFQRQLTANDPVAVKTYARLLDGLRRAGLRD